MAPPLPQVARASFVDSMRFVVGHALPAAIQGSFRKRPFWVRLFGAVHPDPLGRRFVAQLRAKYRVGYIDLRTPGRLTRLVLDPDGVRAVLARSPDVYSADPPAKRAGMRLFQPAAVTISRPPEWSARRHLNDLVLTAAVSPPVDDRLLGVVGDEVGRWHAKGSGRLTWADLRELFDAVTLRATFGDSARDDHALLAALDRLMGRANGPLLLRRPSRAFTDLYAGVGRYLKAADPLSLIGLTAQALRTPDQWPDGKIPSGEVLAAESQVPHWLFAMKDTLAANTAFAIGLLAAHPQHVPPASEQTAADLHADYALSGCVLEAMRLWPTTPMLLREAAASGVLGDVHPPGVQVLIWNAANHRDPAAVPDPDRFVPSRWASGRTHPLVNPLGGGRQGCAGRRLALLLAKAVVAELCRRARFNLEHPRFPSDGPLPETFNWFRFSATASQP